MPPLRNLRQDMFCQEYVKDQNGARSYRAAGYKCGTENATCAGASLLLRTTNIKRRIMELERPAQLAKRKAELKAAEISMIDRAWVVGRLVTNVDRSMQAEAVYDRDGKPTGIYQYEGGVANRGLELIGKNLGMFAEKSPLEGLFAGASVTVSVYLPKKHQSPLIVESNGHDNGPSHSND